MDKFLVCGVLLSGVIAATPRTRCPPLLSILAYREKPQTDPEKLWLEMSGDCFASALVESEPVARHLQRDYLISFIGIASLVLDLDPHRVIPSAPVICTRYSEVIKGIVVERFSNHWDDRFKYIKAVGSNTGEKREAIIRGVSWVVSPFWNLDTVCPELVVSDHQLYRIVLMEKVLRDQFLVGTDLAGPRKPTIGSITVDRSAVLKSSIEQIIGSDFSARWISGNLGLVKVKFAGEAAVDNGGVFRDWVTTVMSALVDEEFLIPTEDRVDVYTINHEKNIDGNYWKLMGIVLGLSLFQDTIIPLQLSVGLFKFINNVGIQLDDFKSEYPEFYKNLKSINLSEKTYFVVNDATGKEIELVPGGKDMIVTSENLPKFLLAMAEWKLVKSLSSQLDFIRDGFHFIVGQHFAPAKLGMVLCQTSPPSLADLLKSVSFQFPKEMTEEETRVWRDWIYRFLVSLESNLGNFIEFVSGMRVLNSRKIEVAIVDFKDNDDRFPTASTCSRTLTIPRYSREEIFSRKLKLALDEGSRAFGLA